MGKIKLKMYHVTEDFAKEYAHDLVFFKVTELHNNGFVTDVSLSPVLDGSIAKFVDMVNTPNGKRVIGINYLKLDGIHLAKNVDTDKFVIIQDAFKVDDSMYCVAESESERVTYKDIEVEEESPQVAEVIKSEQSTEKAEEKEIKTENGSVTSLNGTGNSVNNSKVNTPEFEKPNTVKLNNNSNQDFRQNFNNNRNFHQQNQVQQYNQQKQNNQQSYQEQKQRQHQNQVIKNQYKERNKTEYQFAPTNYD